MIIEIAGVSTENKGAELVLRAILEHYADAANVGFAITRFFGTYPERARYGLRTKLDSFRFGRSQIAAALMPTSFRQSHGLASEADIAGVIDASGFAFGDQLGPERTERFAHDVARWKRQGKPVVLLPQAFGPFESPRLQSAMREVVQQADLIYARDATSLAHLRTLSGENDRIRQAPDFTCLVKAARPDGIERRTRNACIVPNHRMIEKTSAADRDRYVPLLVSCLRELERRDVQAYVLLHDSRIDESLIAPLERAWGRPLRVIRESDPSMLKGILGTAQLVIGSRFHALVSALSLAVPSIAVGWSHKYERLMAEYGCSDCVLSPRATDDQVRDIIGRVIGNDSRNRLIAQLKTAAGAIEDQTRLMWLEVDAALGLPTSHVSGDAAEADSRARDHVIA